MTGYTVHTGSSEKFSQGWDQIFQKKTAKSAKSEKPATAKKAPAKAARKPKKK